MHLSNIILALVSMLAASAAFSQNEVKDTIPDVTNVTKVSLYPGFAYEKRIGKHQTLYGKIFPAINFSFNFSDGIGGQNRESSFYVDPALFLQYRFYYNGSKRQKNGKRTELNSMNYIGIVDRAILTKHPTNSDYYKEERYRFKNTLGAIWGLQRNFKSRVSLDLNIGPAIYFGRTTSVDLNGYLQTNAYTAFALLTQFDVGFWLNKRK